MLTGVMKPLPGFLSENRDKDMVAWKKVYYVKKGDHFNTYEAIIAKLIIPKDAVVVFTNHKCRASYAIVDGFYNYDYLFQPSTDKKLNIIQAFSAWDYNFCYVDGKKVTPDSFDSDPNVVCSHGIHFFRTYKEAQSFIV